MAHTLPSSLNIAVQNIVEGNVLFTLLQLALVTLHIKIFAYKTYEELTP